MKNAVGAANIYCMADCRGTSNHNKCFPYIKVMPIGEPLSD